jgi:hypothetical protein
MELSEGVHDLTKRPFDRILLETIDDALGSLGDSAKQSIYFHLENKFKITKGDIPNHVEGFEAQCFWVTHGGQSQLNTRMALRLTSETVIGPMQHLWVRSHTDLPLKLYQIVTVFRFETRATRPILRMREFDFKEAHTAHATAKEAEAEVEEEVENYRRIFDALEVAYVITRRPEWDKFAGALYSIAFDYIAPDGRTIQVGTVHNLGQNFSKAFNVTYETEKGDREHVWQTCYGISGRPIVGMLAAHGDDNGAVLPPTMAPTQVVIILFPIRTWRNRSTKLVKPLQTTEIGKVKVSHVLEEIMNIALNYGLKIPMSFVLFGKTVITLEGVALFTLPESQPVLDQPGLGRMGPAPVHSVLPGRFPPPPGPPIPSLPHGLRFLPLVEFRGDPRHLPRAPPRGPGHCLGPPPWILHGCRCLGVVLIGGIGDALGLPAAFWSLIGASILALLFFLLLPYPWQGRRPS